MHAMTRREGELMLLGLVEMDESYMGGARKGKRGRGRPRENSGSRLGPAKRKRRTFPRPHAGRG